MTKVLLISPYRGGDATTNDEDREYAGKCIRHSLSLGEAPLAPVWFYTEFCNYKEWETRQLAVWASSEWASVADKGVVYVDNNFSSGMGAAIDSLLAMGKPIEYRSLTDAATPADEVPPEHTEAPDATEWAQGLDNVVYYTNPRRVYRGRIRGISDVLSRGHLSEAQIRQVYGAEIQVWPPLDWHYFLLQVDRWTDRELVNQLIPFLRSLRSEENPIIPDTYNDPPF